MPRRLSWNPATCPSARLVTAPWEVCMVVWPCGVGPPCPPAGPPWVAMLLWPPGELVPKCCPPVEPAPCVAPAPPVVPGKISVGGGIFLHFEIVLRIDFTGLRRLVIENILNLLRLADRSV